MASLDSLVPPIAKPWRRWTFFCLTRHFWRCWISDAHWCPVRTFRSWGGVGLQSPIFLFAGPLRWGWCSIQWLTSSISSSLGLVFNQVADLFYPFITVLSVLFPLRWGWCSIKSLTSSIRSSQFLYSSFIYVLVLSFQTSSHRSSFSFLVFAEPSEPLHRCSTTSPQLLTAGHC
jgi:hypothetical protein